MKHFLLFSFSLLLCVGVACASPARPISKEQLPSEAQQFLQEYFSSAEVTLAREDGPVVRREYEVTLDNGTYIEFSADGQWREVTSRDALPSGIVPRSIESFVAKRYPSQVIYHIERGRRDWEVGLSNGVELTFDRTYRLIDIDD